MNPTLRKTSKDFGTIKIRHQKDDRYGLNHDSIQDEVEEFIKD